MKNYPETHPIPKTNHYANLGTAKKESPTMAQNTIFRNNS